MTANKVVGTRRVPITCKHVNGKKAMSIEFALPDLGEDIESGSILIVSVLVSEGQRIEAGQPVVELETDKAVIEVPCPHGGLVRKLHVGKGDAVEVGRLILTLDDGQEAGEGSRKTSSKCATDGLSDSVGQGVLLETRADELSAAFERNAWGPIRREPLTQIRRTIAEHMSRSVAAIPHVTNFDDADVTELDHFRKNPPDEFRRDDTKLTLMPFVIKTVAKALVKHPSLNAEFDAENGQIVFKQYVNLGVAVDTPRGLVAPVLRDADRLGIMEIARALASLAQRARAAEFEVEELRGGSFTVSNLGAVGGGYSTPIINYPESAILLLGRARLTPAVREDKVEPRLMLPLSLSYDHRLVDGATAVRFLNDVIEQLESPKNFRD